MFVTVVILINEISITLQINNLLCNSFILPIVFSSIMCSNADAIVFRCNSHPMLNERYLLLMLLGKGGFSEVHKVMSAH